VIIFDIISFLTLFSCFVFILTMNHRISFHLFPILSIVFILFPVLIRHTPYHRYTRRRPTSLHFTASQEHNHLFGNSRPNSFLFFITLSPSCTSRLRNLFLFIFLFLSGDIEQSWPFTLCILLTFDLSYAHSHFCLIWTY